MTAPTSACTSSPNASDHTRFPLFVVRLERLRTYKMMGRKDLLWAGDCIDVPGQACWFFTGDPMVAQVPQQRATFPRGMNSADASVIALLPSSPFFDYSHMRTS